VKKYSIYIEEGMIIMEEIFIGNRRYGFSKDFKDNELLRISYNLLKTDWQAK